MVSFTSVYTSNTRLSALPPGLVFVFAGATSGIGLATLQAVARHVNAPRCYIFGRSEERSAHFVDRLKQVNPMGTFIFIEGQCSLISEVDRMCDVVKEYEDHVDTIFLTIGRLRFGAREETYEGLSTDLSLQFYARLRITNNFLPYLERSISPRVISILSAGHEGPLDAEDLEFSKHWSFMKASLAAATMTTLAFEELARKHPTISFVHAHPGNVGTGLVDDLLKSLHGFCWYWGAQVRYLVLPIYKKICCMSPEEAGERTLFLATSAKYPPAFSHEGVDHDGKRLDGWVDLPTGVGAAKGSIMELGRGNGVYRVRSNGETCKEMELLDSYRSQGVGRRVWEHLADVWERALTRRDSVTWSSFEKEGFFSYVSDSDFLDFELEL